MSDSLRITLAQQNFLVGDIEGNAEKIIHAITTARDTQHADLIVFPELALTGYPPEDLLLRKDLYARIDAALPKICAHTNNIAAIIGYPARTQTGCYNRAVFMQQQRISQHYDKQRLPNYQVFDEMRYFQPGPAQVTIIDIRGIKFAITICEDLWSPEPIAQVKAAGANVILSLNASPFAQHKIELRTHILQQRIAETQLPILYVNCVGGQDELVFDGTSMALDNQGRVVRRAASFQEELCLVTLEIPTPSNVTILSQPLPPTPSTEELIYNALVLGLRDYIEKNHFPRAVLGLSGGVDSALTLAIAVDAVGKDRVDAVMMPSRYNAAISLEDAQQQANNLGVASHILPIEPIFQAFLTTLQAEFSGLPIDTTEENLQARCRGALLMALANKKRAIVLATGNKSEMAVGYSTLYGDMVGGFCVLKDVFKTMVYRLAHYRNSIAPIIPERVLTRAPSAELSPNQTDQDTLPPYAILDEILYRYIEYDEDVQSMVDAGFDKALVRRVIQMVDYNEYKRRQAAPGTRITERALGKDRRYPITSGFKPFLI